MEIIKKLYLAIGIIAMLAWFLPLNAASTNVYGDVNGDGEVTIADVNAVIDVIMGDDDNPAADVNNDGEVNIADINTVIDIILGHNTPGIETFTVNGVTFNMVFVEGGTFTMGATPEQGSDATELEKPPHQVTLSSYYIGETEVTQALWLAVMGSNPSWFSPWKGYEENLQRPVERVKWTDCQEFIIKLNEMTGKNFRLPTEAEWEYAARGGKKSQGFKYAGSNNIEEVAWYYDNTTANGGNTNPNYGTHTVGSKHANELGLYDMSGNVAELCQDKWGSYSSEEQTNPTGPSSGINYYRVSRGGGWETNYWGCRVSHRRKTHYKGYNNDIGLRIAL